MALGATVSVRKLKGHPRCQWRCTFKENGRVRQKYFKTKDNAEEFQNEREEEIRAIGVDGGITDAERSTINDYRGRLATSGASLRNVIEAGLDFYERQNRSITVSELFARVIVDRERNRKSEKYLESLRGNLGRFENEFGEQPVSSLNRHEIADWLHGLKLAPATTNTYRKHLIVAFSEAVADGYLTKNPAEQVREVKEIREEVGILTPLETATLLERANDEIRGSIAIGAFAGLRASEIERLDWSQIDLNENLIHLTAADTKRTRGRNVTISKNLRIWLKPLKKKVGAGSVSPANGRKLHEAARSQAGFGDPENLTKNEKADCLKPLRLWPPNALRHSYGSYHLALHENAPATAYQMGHRDVNELYEHYREVVTPTDAGLYWKISPKFGSKEIRKASAT